MEAKDIKYGDLVVVNPNSRYPFIGSNTGDVGVVEMKFSDGSEGPGFYDNQLGKYIKLSNCEKIPTKFINSNREDLIYLIRYGKTMNQMINNS